MMLGNLFENLRSFQEQDWRQDWIGRSFQNLARSLAIGGACLLRSVLRARPRRRPPHARRWQAKYPAWKGKTWSTPSIRIRRAMKRSIQGIPTNMSASTSISASRSANASASKLTYKAVTFAALLTTLSSGQADIVISDIYATEERAKAADFITYSKCSMACWWPRAIPKKITGINTSMCGAAAAENTGFVEVPLVQDLIPKCKAEGKPEPTLQLYDNNANCIQAILAGRADTYVNDVNTVDQAVKAKSRQAGKGDRGDDSLFRSASPCRRTSLNSAMR